MSGVYELNEDTYSAVGISDDDDLFPRFSGDNIVQFFAYLPFGLLLLALRTVLALVLWIASIVLPKKSSVRQLLSVLACCTFGECDSGIPIVNGCFFER